jgi:hypothetical protein
VQGDLPIGLFAPSSPESRGYSADPGLNYSTLKHMAVSAKHYKYALDSGWEPTKSMTMGVSTHLAILQPERLMQSIVIWEHGDRKGAAWKEFEAEHAGRTILKRKEFDADAGSVMARAREVRAHEVASKYLGGHAEMAMFWNDPFTGMRCKARPDLICGNTIPDLKTCADAGAEFFGRQTAKLMYHAQAAFYREGLAQVAGYDTDEIVNLSIVVESKPPHDVVVYDPEPEDLLIGRDMIHEWIKRVVECRESGKWPGRAPNSIVRLALPAWARPHEDDDLSSLGLEM